MCGRFLLTYDIEEIKNYYGQPNDPGFTYTPQNETFPSQPVIVLAQSENGPKLAQMIWGYSSSYRKGLLINARGETASQKPTFRSSFANKRCLVPANGFFEWKKEENGKKKFHISYQDHRLFSIAGLFRTEQNEKGDQVNTCILITTEPNSKLSKIHNRMPAILPREKEAAWLDKSCQDPKTLTSLLTPFDPEGTLLQAVQT